MPRITEVIVDHPYYGERRFTIVRSLRLDVAEAVEFEHDCDENSCDISAAMAHGYPLAAAHLLTGATDELHVLDAVLGAHTFNGDDVHAAMLADFDQWCENLPAHWECDCGAIIWEDDDTYCGNCGAQRADDDDNEIPAHVPGGLLDEVRQAELWGGDTE